MNPLFASPSRAGRHAPHPLECPAEGGFRLVTELLRDLPETASILLEPPRRDEHGGLYKSGPTVLALAMPNTPRNPTPAWRYFNVDVSVHMHSCVMKLSGGIDAALVINSSIRSSSKDACDVLGAAYDEAK